MRNNENYFTQINGIPTSEQIGEVLVKNGFKRSETEFEVIYTK